MKISQKKLAVLNIIISLIAAGAIMALSAYWPNSFPNSMYIVIAIWFVPFGIINGLAAKNSKGTRPE
jgi:hypothetical protein